MAGPVIASLADAACALQDWARRARFKAFALTFALLSGSAVAQSPVTVMAFGDSLFAGYGLSSEDGFVPQLEAWLFEQGVPATVVNAGVSGDTSAGGRARLDWLLAGGAPDFAILELGANDALRGIVPEETEANLRAIMQTFGKYEVDVLIAGMLAPRNLGEDYVAAFDAIYPKLSDEFNAPLYPFVLDGIATRPELFQSDGLHPNEEGAALMAAKIGAALLPILEADAATSATSD